ncbi:MAG: T9SS type A sorting domain-containing protein [Ignavibacteria bacterium]|nr:T9SS type A sorting domain-containing protein [Ignavibacteria bacterium]
MMIEDSISLNYNTGGFMAIWNGELVTGNNSSINFGGESFLKVLGNSKLHFGENSGFTFTDNSYLYSSTYDTAVIQYAGFDESTLWNGVQISNSLNNDTNNLIRDCIFSQTKTAITIKNNQASAFVNRVIKNCTFNIPSGGDHKGIYGENNYSLLVEGNRFNMPASPGGSPFYTGLYLKNVTPSSPPEAAGEEGASATPYSLNIVNNTFRNGSSGIVLANYTSNLLPYYIKGNRFDSLDAHAATVNIIGMKITGSIKDNVLSSSLTPIGIHLINSSPNLLNNIIVARDVSLHLVGSSYANLAPNIYNNQAYWSGGRNTLSSYLYDNIQLAYMGNAYSDYGRNKFTVSNDSAYHIYGWLDTNVLRYHSRDNCWYTSGATRIYLRHPGATLPVPSTTYNYGINCNSSPGPISWEVDNLGNGIFDSVLVSEDVSDSIPSAEEILISQCDHYLNEMQMFGEAVISLKYYIDDYPEGEYVNDALMDLYTAYLYLDTSADQNNRNILYGNLINYCEDKVAGNLYDAQFEYLAGDVIAMCNFELDNYDDAMNWYEFIALFYPDPDVRLSASWNYAEIEALIGSGSGGGETEIENGKLKIESVEGRASTEYIEFLEELEIEKLHEEIVDDPVMRKLMKKFENKNHSDGMEQANRSADSPNTLTKHSDAEAGMTAKLKNDKARKNIFSSKSMSREQQEADRMKDIFLITANARNGKIAPGIAGIPFEFSLHQNFPNPFNPVTTISYDLPNSGFVRLKVYDMLGREVKTLVNAIKTAGFHRAQFKAERLACGAYFYRLSASGEAGEFVAARKCVVVK